MLHIHHSNSLDQLADDLLQQMDQHPPQALASDIVLVQNPGMKRWLQQRIAAHRGIAAHIQFPLPSRFVWDIFMRQFDDVPSLSAFDGEVLRWRIMALLQQALDDPALQPLKSFVQGEERQQAEFQLAQKLAALFDQYLVYRPAMIEQWERGGDGGRVNEAWQARLWRRLRAGNDEPHRAALIQRLVERLQSPSLDSSTLPTRVFVFGISALSPLHLNVLAALGQAIDLHFFNHNPCAHYWGDIEDRKAQLRRGEAPLEINELLASLGKQGRDYIDQFYQLGYPFEEHEAFVDIAETSLLQRIQRDILYLRNPQDGRAPARLDSSIQIVSCYSELRELQVLHDRLLDLLQQDPSLQPHDIVVMCPQIDQQAALIEAVFGQQDAHKRIPFSISDHNPAASEPLMQTVLDWIGLPTSRFSASEILGWLELPALQRTYALDDAAIDSIRYWVLSNHIHWAVDGAHKQRLGFAKTDLNTWRQGIERLLAAYVMNDDVQLLDDLPVSDVVMSHSDLLALGQLQRLLDDLQQWSTQFSRAMTLPQWQQSIHAMMQQLLMLDEDEEWRMKPLRDEIAAWCEQAQQAHFEQPLGHDLIAPLLQQALQQGTAQHHYLTGQINFCNLIPMRSLPFRVVCLIGMGDAQFPRNQAPLQLDLIKRYPQKGDRSSREDDRYAFLQAILSAQQSLYISYVGRDRRDDAELQPSVVVTELMDYMQRSCAQKPVIEQTPLQAFSPHNFIRGSYAEQWLLQQPLPAPEPFAQPLDDESAHQAVSVQTLIRFFNNPQRYFLQHRLNLSLDESIELIEDDEVFTLDPLQRYQINRELLDEMLAGDEPAPQRYLNSGMLAEQQVGELQLQQQQEAMMALAQRLRSHEQFSGRQRYQHTLSWRGHERDYELNGQVESYSDQGLLDYNLSALKGKSMMTWWIRHCFLCATQAIDFSQLVYPDKSRIAVMQLDILAPVEAQTRLAQLIEAFEQGQREILPFYVDTAYQYEQQKTNPRGGGEDSARKKIRQLWRNDGRAHFHEAQDVYTLTSRRGSGLAAGEFPPQFFEWSQTLMAPLIAASRKVK